MEDITVDINADISGYSSSLTQAIAVADQFTKASDNMLGRLNQLNGISVKLIKSTTAFTGANKLGTAQAAAYQQQLSKIEASAKASGKNFGELEKTTKKFARDFPIGIKGAADTVQALQKAGVTANKDIQALGKTFVEVGAAAGEFGPELGSNLLQLTRTFGNSQSNLQKYADSLIKVTSKFGASASSVVDFSKAIAPVASTVGMSETSVIGLSTAMSRLGEDGYRAANAFNKVLIDMSKSIRTGSPEIREYAAVMGMTTEALQTMMKQNPTDVVVKFTEAIKSQGTDAIRVLDDLGLEGISTFKAISALSREGNLGEIIDEASAAFGGGSAAEAAATALGGVNDQMMRLQESMSQTVASTGKPFLGFLEDVLGGANALSDGIAQVAESDVVQAVSGKVAPAAAVLSSANSAIGAVSTAALVKTGYDMVRKSGFANEFRQGVDKGAVGMAAPNSIGGRLGGFFGQVRGPNIVDAPSALGKAIQMGQMGGRMAGNLTALNYRLQASAIDRATGGQGFSTTEGKAVRAAQTDFTKALKTGDAAQITAATKAYQGAIAQYMTANKGLVAQTGNLSKAFAQASVAATKFAAGAVAKTGGVLSSLGITGPMLAIGAAAAVGMMVKKQADDNIENAKSAISESGYAAFNQFAEKTGLATRAIADFSASVKEATLSLAAENTTREDAFDISQAEVNNATKTGYVPGFEIGGMETSNIATQETNVALAGRLMLGKNPSYEAIAQFLSDVTHQKGQPFGDAVSITLKSLLAEGVDVIQLGLEAITEEAYKDKGNWLPGSDREVEFSDLGDKLIQGMTSEIQRSAAGIESTVGGNLATKFMQDKIKELFDIGGKGVMTNGMFDKEKTTEYQQAISEIISNLTGNEGNTSFQEMVRGYMEAEVERSQLGAAIKTPNFDQFVEAVKSNKNYSQGVLGAPSKKNAQAVIGQAQIDAASSQIVAEVLTGNSELFNLADALYAAEGAARKYNMTTEELTEEQLSTLSDIERKLFKARNSTSDPKVQAQTAADVIAEMSKTSSFSDIRKQAAVYLSNTAQTTDTRSILSQLYSTAAQMESLSMPAMSSAEQRSLTMERGASARAMGFVVDADVRAANEQAIQAEQQVYADMVQQARQYLTQERELNIQMANAEEDLNIQRARGTRNFKLQQLYAERDYNKQIRRANRDFNIQMREAQEDFDRQRERTLEQKNRQVARMMEDAASQMYAPFQRIQAKDVFDTAGLTSNLVQQAKAVREQMSSVDALMKQGVSQQVVDQLGLGKAENAQQVQRMLRDIANNPALISQLNAAVALKGDVSGEMVTNQSYNQDFRRSEEDFRISLQQQDEDFNISIDRANQKFQISMNDMAFDFAESMARSVKAFKLSMREMLQDFNRSRERAYDQLARFGDDMANLLSAEDLIDELGKSFDRLPALFSNKTMSAIKSALEQYPTWLGEQVSYVNDSLTSKSVVQWVVNNPSATFKDLKENLGTFMKSSAKAPDIKAVMSYIRDEYSKKGSQASYISVAEIAKNIVGNSNYKKVFLAEGGIVTRQTDAVIAEAGYPEAVVPLNHRGANMLAEAMGRYVSSTDVLSSRMTNYSSPVTNHSSYTYDQKTMFNGPITVQSQNPDDMARQLAARARRNRLGSPFRSR